jgi:hypothetical protein
VELILRVIIGWYVYDQFQDLFCNQQNQAQIKEEKMKSDCQQVAETSTDPTGLGREFVSKLGL